MDSFDEDGVHALARAFFQAATKASGDSEDILPQEDGEESKLSVFYVFAELFPDAVGENGAGAGNKRMRLHFNKIGYSMYGKEQSRRVPSLRAKPGNPGYGFRRARWRDTLEDKVDRETCEACLREAGCDDERIQRVVVRVQEVGHEWDRVRKPSRPAGPGRPRRHEGDSPVSLLGPSAGLHSAKPCGHQVTRTQSFPLSHEGSSACEARGQGVTAPSPVIKRWRENDVFSPSIYPRLTALKLESPAKTPAPSPGQLCFRSYEGGPALNRSPCGPATHDPALQLPPLDLASANIQPSGGVEDAPAEHRVLAASTTRRILQGDAGNIKVAPPSPSDAVVHRGIRRTGHGAHGRENVGWGAFSALEFLATAAEAQRVSSI